MAVAVAEDEAEAGAEAEDEAEAEAEGLGRAHLVARGSEERHVPIGPMDLQQVDVVRAQPATVRHGGRNTVCNLRAQAATRG